MSMLATPFTSEVSLPEQPEAAGCAICADGDAAAACSFRVWEGEVDKGIVEFDKRLFDMFLRSE